MSDEEQKLQRIQRTAVNFAPAFLQGMKGFCAGSSCVQQASPCLRQRRMGGDSFGKWDLLS